MLLLLSSLIPRLLFLLSHVLGTRSALNWTYIFLMGRVCLTLSQKGVAITCMFNFDQERGYEYSIYYMACLHHVYTLVTSLWVCSDGRASWGGCHGQE